ncbi:MAG: metallophosphoesterase [Flavihumibacter sp.]
MRSTGMIWTILLILVVLDIYIFQALKVVTHSAAHRTRLIVFSAYWLVSVLTLLFLVFMPTLRTSPAVPQVIRTYVFAMVVGMFFSKLVAAIFLMIDDIRRGMTWVVSRLFSNPTVEVSQTADGITRSTFMSWLGLALGGTLLGSLVIGFSNKYNYKVRKVRLQYPNLPDAFRGLRVVQISDVHSGSFTDRAAVQKGVQKVLDLAPDLILFTGDLVNDRATEMDHYKAVFSQLKAPMGVFSTLGNHDYGDYVEWESPAAKSANLEALKRVHADIGWRLLMNEHVVLERGGAQIALLGIENWGAKGNFPKYGKMSEAYPGTEKYPFKILMSHDPSHWDAEVLEKYKDIDLMLSGHTHGMQFGVELPWFKWSPVEYMYKQWAGLYEEGAQKLYVNRGFGFIGYPGRVGILPEITLLELV